VYFIGAGIRWIIGGMKRLPCRLWSARTGFHFAGGDVIPEW
jgi:hypothetical protein